MDKQTSAFAKEAREKSRLLLSKRGMTISELGKAIDRSASVTSKIIKDMRSEIYISGWKRSKRGPIAPRYRIGKGKDATKPEPINAAEKCRRWRNTAEGRTRRLEYGRQYDSAVRARRKIESKGLSAIDPLMAAIMGF